MSLRHLVPLFIFSLGCGGGSTYCRARPAAASVTDVDGWVMSGNAQSTSVKPDFSDTGGNPDGLISAKDDVTGGVWYFVAPARCPLVTRPSFIAGKALKFDLKVDKVPTNPFNDIDVKLIGGGVTLVFDTPNNRTEQWTSYSVPLTAAGWKVHTLGAAAIDADMTNALKDTTALWIRRRFDEGPTPAAATTTCSGA